MKWIGLSVAAVLLLLGPKDVAVWSVVFSPIFFAVIAVRMARTADRGWLAQMLALLLIVVIPIGSLDLTGRLTTFNSEDYLLVIPTVAPSIPSMSVYILVAVALPSKERSVT